MNEYTIVLWLVPMLVVITCTLFAFDAVGRHRRDRAGVQENSYLSRRLR